MDGQIVLVTDARSGAARLSAKAMAAQGHIVYAAMDETVARAIELDAGSQASVDRAIARIVASHGRIDVIVHNADPMAFGPAEAFAPEQFAKLHDLVVLSAQRVNRAALPHMRRRGRGLLVWVSSSGLAAGTRPYLAPHAAAKAAVDALAVQYARELARWGIETSIVMSGAFTRGSAHFAQAERPADAARLTDYSRGPTAGLDDEIRGAFARIVPDDAGAVAATIEPGRRAVRRTAVPCPHRFQR